MVQRGPTYIMSVKRGIPRLLCNTHSLDRTRLLTYSCAQALYWQGGVPTDIADRLNASFPTHIAKLLQRRVTKDIADADKYVITLSYL